MTEYHLKKKKQEMEQLMTRFTRTNMEHQHLMNENIQLVAQIRKRKKEEVRKIRVKQKDKFKKKVKDLKKTILKQSKMGNQGETILRNSVLEKHFEEYSVVEDQLKKEDSNFFSKIKESIMIFGGSPGRSRSRSRKKGSVKALSPKKPNYNFKKTKKVKSSQVIPDDESQIIDQKNFRKIEKQNFQKFKGRSKVNNFSDTSEETKSFENTSIDLKNKNKNKKKSGSKRFSPDKKLTTGNTLNPSNSISHKTKELTKRKEKSRNSEFSVWDL